MCSSAGSKMFTNQPKTCIKIWTEYMYIYRECPLSATWIINKRLFGDNQTEMCFSRLSGHHWNKMGMTEGGLRFKVRPALMQEASTGRNNKHSFPWWVSLLRWGLQCVRNRMIQNDSVKPTWVPLTSVKSSSKGGVTPDWLEGNAPGCFPSLISS